MKYLVVYIGLVKILLIILRTFTAFLKAEHSIFLANNSSLLWYWKLNQIITVG